MRAIESGKVNPLIKWALAANAQQFIPVLDTIDRLTYDTRKFNALSASNIYATAI
ncbi:MAG: hypothetical protein ACJAW8_002871 [Oleispira sp.]|jgi:hypothetical protein